MKEIPSLRIVFFGTPQLVIPILEKLTDNFDIVAVVTTPDSQSGRKKVLTPTPVKQFSTHKNIRTILTLEQFNDEAIEQLNNLAPDLFVVVAYGHLLPKNLLSIPKYGTLNVHPSLLPKYRGPSPIQTAMINGDTKTGVTIIQIDEELDHGPILTQWDLPIHPDDTNVSLHEKAFEDAAKRLPEIIKEFVAGKRTLKDQDLTKATYTEKITKQDGYFDLDNPPDPEKLDRMIRAYYPWPTAWTRIRIKNQDVRIKFLPEKKVQVEGGKAISIKDFLNGYPEMKEKILKLTISS